MVAKALGTSPAPTHANTSAFRASGSSGRGPCAAMAPGPILGLAEEGGREEGEGVERKGGERKEGWGPRGWEQNGRRRGSRW